MQRLLLAFVLLPLLSCQKKDDFLYIHPDKQQVSADHKLKELVGSQDLDILWVIDNSGSMEAHQQTVIDNMDQFIDGLVSTSPLKWKSGLISTSQGENPYIGFAPGDELDHTMADASSRFKDAVANLGTSGDGREQTFQPVLDVLNRNPKFLRPTAALALILISDAPEQSDISTSDFVTQLSAYKGGDLTKILFYGFLNPEDWCTPTDDPFIWAGNKFDQLLHMIKGNAYKLCDPNFGQNLAGLGSNLSKIQTSPKILLKDQPLPATIKVLHNGVVVPGGTGGAWYYDASFNAVVFSDLSFAPGDNESVTIQYQVDDGIT